MTQARHRAPARNAARKWLGALLTPLALALLLTFVFSSVGAKTLPTPSAASASAAGAITGTVSRIDIKEMEALRAATRASRSGGARTARQVELKPTSVGAKFATANLNLWLSPREQGRRVGMIDASSKVAVTGQKRGHWAEVLLKGNKVRWVNNDFLANKKPKPATSTTSSAGATTTSTTSGLSGAACPDGSSVESGLTSTAVRLYRAVCAAFPTPTTYGGYDGHGEHADGRAIDIMISGSTGYAIADWLRANAGALGVRDIIFAQRIWTPDRAGEGWRSMSSRGSATADHYDHVHVAVY